MPRLHEPAALAVPGQAPVSTPAAAAEWQLHCDGSALPNPGRMGLGAVLTSPDGARHNLSMLSPDVGCNNEAELRALMAGLGLAEQQGAGALRVWCDSSILVEQLQSQTAKPIARLAALFDEARALLARFPGGVRLGWIPQRRNGEADALARAALGLTQARQVKAGKKGSAKSARSSAVSSASSDAKGSG